MLHERALIQRSSTQVVARKSVTSACVLHLHQKQRCRSYKCHPVRAHITQALVVQKHALELVNAPQLKLKLATLALIAHAIYTFTFTYGSLVRLAHNRYELYDVEIYT